MPRRVATSSFHGRVDESSTELSLLTHHMHEQAANRPKAAAVYS